MSVGGAHEHRVDLAGQVHVVESVPARAAVAILESLDGLPDAELAHDVFTLTHSIDVHSALSGRTACPPNVQSSGPMKAGSA